MRIVQTAFGVFHHFALARELHRRQHLERVYSTWPWARLRREHLPRHLVRTFPWLHTPEYLLARTGLHAPWLFDQTGYANALLFDAFTSRQLSSRPAPDALIALSGSSLRTGRELQARGTVFFCDRGSSHQRFQQQILAEEYARWKIDLPISDPRDTAREEAIYAQADAIVIPSTFAARSFLQQGVPPHKVHTLPLGVDLSAFPPACVRPDPERFDVLFAGAVGLRKGVPYLLQAFARLRHPYKRLRLAGAIQPDLKLLLARLPLEGVEFLGALPQSALRDQMCRSHVLVLPSIEDGFGMVLAQAMASGCPVLCSTNTGAEDILSPASDNAGSQGHATEHPEGYIVPIRDSQALTVCLQRLADDPLHQQQMAAAALERVTQLGGWSDYGDRWEQLLNRYLSPPPTK